jgi:uncharacterized Rossmann fold enzyme
MDWPTWEPTYAAILAEFGYDRIADERARDELDDLLADRWQADLDALRSQVRGHEVVVLGGAPHGALPLGPLFVADPREPPPRQPTLIVTDLDGDVALQVALNAVGIPIAVHAHGDNRLALSEHVPRLRGPVLGTTQAERRGRVHNFGGFTDGDRACCIAAELGAASLALAGFDFSLPAPKPGRDPGVKTRKLAWAKKIIDGVGIPVRFV